METGRREAGFKVEYIEKSRRVHTGKKWIKKEKDVIRVWRKNTKRGERAK